MGARVKKPEKTLENQTISQIRDDANKSAPNPRVEIIDLCRELSGDKRFYALKTEILRLKPVRAGMQVTDHGQHYASGFHEGVDYVLRMIPHLATDQSDDEVLKPFRDVVEPDFLEQKIKP